MKTKADKIRAMSDEELAEVLSERLDCSSCPVDDCGGVGHWCKKALLKWLKQPVKEDA